MIDTHVLGTAQRLGSRALSWLHAAHRDGLGRIPDNTLIDFADADNAYKPLGEVALATSLVLRDGVSGPADTRAARELLDGCWAQLREGDLLYERQLHHFTMTDPLETYGHFARAGYRHPPLEDLLDSLSRLRAAHAEEIRPNRRLGVANARRVVGLDHRPDWEALALGTWLGARPEPWAVNWMTGYDITHTVFHLTDWGARPDGLPEPMRDYVRDWLPVWLDAWAEVGQWDLVAELLVVDACVGEPATGHQGWDALAAVQHEDGLLPRDGDPVDGDRERVFLDHQHTAVVAVVAGDVTLARALRATAAG
ncbi:DUF6895 family protein [Kitasatospora cineracea]|uniref:DUF6895 domain-containing protein n=1 Tax=Kitasatospora cineracea TaxID=88074 RepID=A0A3N4RZM8_9ACTN|nr:hypothetical protein [Kitasatospora cineracea]ROR46036.1 hypothetical protein EDD39_4291 [Kitasatospora cineracea]RPE36409.1 hypothetical protein EDD38_4782 [Kitasatospora cineracea]